MPFGIDFDAKIFASQFVGRKARRWLDKQFSRLGKGNLIYAIKSNKDLIDFIPREELYKYKSDVQQYKDYFDFFTDDDIYSWIPDLWKGMIEAQPKGKEWAYRQLPLIKELLFGS